MEGEPGGHYLEFILLAQSGDYGVWLAFLIVFILVLGSALISGSEVAFFSLDNQTLDTLRGSQRSDDKTIINLIEKPGILLATILITNNFINIAIIIISSYALGELFEGAAFPAWFDFMINVVLVTFILVLFGETLPKIYANINNLKMARVVGRPLSILKNMFLPLSKILVKATNLIENRLKKDETEDVLNMEDISQVIELTAQNENASKQEVDILKGIIHFRNTIVKQAAKARTMVVALDIEETFQEVMHKVKECNYSRIPVYRESMDNILGILYVKDLLPHLGETDEQFNWQKVIRKPTFLEETIKLEEALALFKKRRVHIGIVVDEYGGMAGIITLEDIMEEIIGEIQDEFDDEVEIDYTQKSENTYEFDAHTMIHDVCRIMDMEQDTFDKIREDSDSLGGLILQIHKSIPEEKTVITYENYQFLILSADERRIKRVQFTVLNKEV